MKPPRPISAMVSSRSARKACLVRAKTKMIYYSCRGRSVSRITGQARRRVKGSGGGRPDLSRPWSGLSRLAEEVIPHGLLVGIPVPVVLVGLLFDAPDFVEQ